MGEEEDVKKRERWLREKWVTVRELRRDMREMQGFMQDKIIASHTFWWTHGC